MRPIGKSMQAASALALATLALLAGCGGPQRHNDAENEFSAWANQIDNQSAGMSQIPDYGEPNNVLARVVPANEAAPANAQR